MNKMLITTVAVTLLISGCGDKEDAASGQAEPSAVEKAMESAGDAMDSATDMASDAAESAGDAASDAMDSATDMASDAAESAGDAASDVADSAAAMAAGATESVSDAADDAGDMMSDATETAGAAGDGGAIGQEVYTKSCLACHAVGVAGAPKLGDKAAWAPRIATGMDALLASTINGKNVMPPRGTCMSCSDDDLKAAVEYMVSQSQ
jgi:cytochrome c5